MKTIKVTDDEIAVLLQGIDAIGWTALPVNHPERRAAETLRRKLIATPEPEMTVPRPVREVKILGEIPIEREAE